MSSNFCSDAFELNDVASISSSSSSQSATKENTILITLLDESCSNKAEALRLQQVFVFIFYNVFLKSFYFLFKIKTYYSKLKKKVWL